MPDTISPDGYFVMGASTNTDPYMVSHAANISVHVVCDNTDAAGKIQIQVGNILGNWAPVYFYDNSDPRQYLDGYTVTAGNDVNWFVDVADLAAKYMRISWQRTSGEGGLTYAICVKKQR